MADLAEIFEPKAILARLEARSERFETPCGDGHMVWHVWGEGDALVLLHGGNGSWRHWVRNIPVLARHYRVVVPDLPGLGESAQVPRPESAETIASTVARGLDRVVGSDTGYDIVGFSFGGMISGLVAAIGSKRVRSLTLIGPGGLSTARRTVVPVGVRALAGAERAERHRINLAQQMLHDPRKIDDLAVEIQEWNSVHNRLRTPLLSRTMALVNALGRVDARVNAIYGEFDSPLAPNAEERRKLLQSIVPAIDFRVIAGVGHWVAYEAPEVFNAMLFDMLRPGLREH
jgi:pimeloyl-ACP methyl ester carboxylesterase